MLDVSLLLRFDIIFNLISDHPLFFKKKTKNLYPPQLFFIKSEHTLLSGDHLF